MRLPPRPIIILVALLLAAACLVTIRASRGVLQAVTVASLANASVQAPVGSCFRVTNGDERAILLIDLVAETNGHLGWSAFSHTVPSHPQRLATGETKDLVVAPPPNGVPWRLRVAYGRDVKGPALWLDKAVFVVTTRRWAGQGFGVMAGSNSCLSAELNR
jgi:hypothetical protein